MDGIYLREKREQKYETRRVLLEQFSCRRVCLEQFFLFEIRFLPGDPEPNPKKNNFSTGVKISAIPGSLVSRYCICDTHTHTQSVTQTQNMFVHFVCQDISPRYTSSFPCWILVMYLWAGKLVRTPDQVGDVHRLIDGQTKLREELWNDVDRVRNELRMETASRKEDMKSHRKQIKAGVAGPNNNLQYGMSEKTSLQQAIVITKHSIGVHK